MVLGFVLVALLAAWVYWDAKTRQVDKPAVWALGTFLLAIVVLPVWLIKRPATGGPTRPCVHCAEPIQRAAVVCRHCGRDVPPAAVPPVSGPTRTGGAQVVRGVFVAVVIIVGVGIVTGIAVIFPTIDSLSGSTSSSLTLAEYNELTTGMSYQEVVAILGRGGVEQSRASIAGSTTVMYTWSGSGTANMNAMFQDNRLVTKAQFGLK